MAIVPTHIEDVDPERHRWRKATRFPHSVAQVREVNEQLLALLVDLATSESDDPDWQAEIRLGRVLKEVDPAARERLALCPFLLVDAGFRDASRWQRSVENDTPVLSEIAALPVGPHAKFLKLARSTCVLSWYLVRTDAIAARLVSDVSPECEALIAGLGLMDLQQIAERLVQQRWLKPRWHNRLDVWHRLIRLEQVAPRKAFASVNVRGRQLLLGDDLLVDDAQ